MGAYQSSIVELPIIHPQPEPICATEPRLCLPHNVKLHLSEKHASWSNGYDYKVMDANNKDIIYFRTECRVLTSKKILKDYMGVPVLNQKSNFNRNKFNIFARKGSEQWICKFKKGDTYRRLKLSTEFPDVLTGRIQHLVMECDTRSYICSICLGEPSQGGAIIASIYRRDGGGYILEIAANVDIAICVMMCIAFIDRT